MKLENKISLITGGARGIGRQIALSFAQAGSDLAICDVDEAAVNQTKNELEQLTGRRVMAGKVDVTSMTSCQEFVDKILEHFGRLDILINNAGITRDKLIMRMGEDDWDLVLNVNLKGAFNCIKAVTRPMMKQRSGKIVNMASIIGIIGNPGQANYSASKGGLIALTKTAAKEFGSRGINVNAIAPGYIRTDMTDKLSDEIKEKMISGIPLGQMGLPQDVANLAIFLASDDSSYITGEVIKVDGGMAI